MPESRIADAVLTWIGRTTLDTSRSLEAFSKDARTFVGDFLAQVMTPEQRELLSLERYSLSAWEPKPNQPLRAWEDTWFTEDLPPAPASILLPGCGSGRELIPLLDKGYEVLAFDGAPGALEIAKRLARGRAEVSCATFDDLVNAASGDRSSPLAGVVDREFSAVLLGWGALTHCAGAQRRRAVLRACCSITAGPVLASFYSRSPEPLSRAGRWGRTTARKLGRQDPGPSPVEFSHWGGFAEYITKEEIAGHAASLNRDVKWSEGGSIPFPHITLTPRHG